MAKKFTVLLSVLAFASASSFALACETTCCKGKKGDTKTELTSDFDVFGGKCGGGSCGDKGDKA